MLSECMEVAQACRSVVRTKDKALELKDLALTTCTTAAEDFKVEADTAERRLSAWYRSPLVLFLGGVVVGSLATVYLKNLK